MTLKEQVEKFVKYSPEDSDEYGDRYHIELNEELATILDGRCFLDLDMPERIEGFRFNKTETGLDCLYIGCGVAIGYCHNVHDDYENALDNNLFCGCDIVMVSQDHHLIREISEKEFNRMNQIVNEQIKKIGEREREFKELQKEFFLKKCQDGLNNCCVVTTGK